MSNMIRNALGMLAILMLFAASHVRADCNLDLVSLVDTWKENTAAYPEGGYFIGKMHYEIVNNGEDGCDLSVDFWLTDEEDPPEYMQLVHKNLRFFLSAGESIIANIPFNFSSRDYPNLPGAKYPYDQILANNSRWLTHDGASGATQARDWPGDP